VTDTYTYDVFGAVRTHTGTNGTEFTFTGEQNDPNGLEYLRARYYDPASGRFIGEDPAPARAYQPATLNRYVYSLNNPVNLLDPTGREVGVMAWDTGMDGGGGGGLFWLILALFGGGATVAVIAPVFFDEDIDVPPRVEAPPALPPAPPVPSDPTQPPGPGWEWKGTGPPGSDQGSWWNPATDEYLRPDFEPSSHGPHWDYRDPDGVEWRIYPDGTMERKE